MGKILIVEDHRLYREGLKDLLESEASLTGWEIIISGDTSQQAINLIKEQSEDISVLLIDGQLPQRLEEKPNVEAAVEVIIAFKDKYPTAIVIAVPGNPDCWLPMQQGGADYLLEKIGFPVEEFIKILKERGYLPA